MKLVLFNDNEEIIEVISDVEGLEIEEKENEVDAVWNNGRIVGLKAKFIVLDDQEIEENEKSQRPTKVTEHLKEKNRGNEFKKKDVHSLDREIKRLEARLVALEKRPEHAGNNGQPS